MTLNICEIVNSFSGRVDERSFAICSGETKYYTSISFFFFLVWSIPVELLWGSQNCYLIQACGNKTVFFTFISWQVGSNTLLVDPATGVEYRGREYPWGIVNIEDQVIDDDDDGVLLM